MPNLVRLDTLITRVRQRYGGELATGSTGSTANITDWEITDCLNVSLATELYDLMRQSVGDLYYDKPYLLTTTNGVQSYDLPGDFLTCTYIDVWLGIPGTPGAQQLKINARRYMIYERNLYQTMLIGWSAGSTVLYTLTGPQIRFQPTPVQALNLEMHYVPTSPQLGRGQKLDVNSNPLGVPNSYADTWDDVDGWAEVAVLDAAKKVCLKLNRLDMIQAINVERADLRKRIMALVALRHAGEPERANFPLAVPYGDGYMER